MFFKGEQPNPFRYDFVPRVNCIGYVYHELKIDPKEKFRDPGLLESLLKDFDEVPDVTQAQAVAVVYPLEDGSLFVDHCAIIEDAGKMTIRHRAGKNAEIRPDTLSTGLDFYLKANKRAKKVFLTRKDQ